MKMKMMMGDDKKDNKLLDLAKDEAVDIAIDKAAQIAHISMPVDMLELMLSLFKTLEKELLSTNSKERER